MEDTEESRAESKRKRRTTKAVNYAKEQQFSDASDIFEDSDAENAPKAKKRGRPRKSDANEPTVYTGGDDDGFKKLAPVYTERGYDPSLLPIRERFDFLPEFEPDGSPSIELIVGRRPIGEKGDGADKEDNSDDEEKKEDGDSDDEEDDSNGKRTRRSMTKEKKDSPDKKKMPKDFSAPVEYEYLIKYKGRSYLHLDWKTGADLESMGKTGKSMYRRYLKKVAFGDEELEDPTVEDSFITPQRICDEAKQEITVELSDKELLKWEKQRLKELAEEESSDDSEDDKKDEKDKKDADGADGATPDDKVKEESEEKPDEEMKDAEEKKEEGAIHSSKPYYDLQQRCSWDCC